MLTDFRVIISFGHPRLGFRPHPPTLILTVKFRATFSAVIVLTVGGAVLHLWDRNQEPAVVPEHRHGQFASALLHQVLGLQQGQVFCCDAVDLV